MMGVSRETEVSKLYLIVNDMHETTKPPGNDYETISDLKRNNRIRNVQPEFPAQRTKADESDYERLKKKAAAGREAATLYITWLVIINIGLLGFLLYSMLNRCTDCAHKDCNIYAPTCTEAGVACVRSSSDPGSYSYCDCDFSDDVTGYACSQTASETISCDEGFIAVAKTNPYKNEADIGLVDFATCEEEEG